MFQKNRVTPTFSVRSFPLKVASILLKSNDLFDKESLQFNEKTAEIIPSVNRLLELFNKVEGIKLDGYYHQYMNTGDETSNDLHEWSTGHCSSIHIPKNKVRFDDKAFMNELGKLFDLYAYALDNINSLKERLYGLLIIFNDKEKNLIFNLTQDKYHLNPGYDGIKIPSRNPAKLLETFLDALTIIQ